MTDELERLEHELAEAVRHSDRALAEPLLADDFVLTSALGTGFRLEREGWLESLPSIATQRLELRDLQVEVVESAGVVVWLMDWSARMGDDDLSGPYVVVDVWASHGGSWRLRWRSWARLNAEFLRPG